MIIGNYNIFSVGCKIESSNIGSNNTFESKSNCESGCTIGDNCKLGSFVKIMASIYNLIRF